MVVRKGRELSVRNEMTDQIVYETKETNVPDPYYTEDFDYTYQLLSEACQQLLTHIKKNNLIA